MILGTYNVSSVAGEDDNVEDSMVYVASMSLIFIVHLW